MNLMQIMYYFNANNNALFSTFYIFQLPVSFKDKIWLVYAACPKFEYFQLVFNMSLNSTIFIEK